MAVFERFRAPERDRQTDIERFAAVEAEIGKALLSVERERAGLSRRLEEARTRAASLLGNEDGIYFEREPAEERMLAEAEAQMMQAYARLDQLQTQHALLASLLGQLKNSGGGAGRSEGSTPLSGTSPGRTAISAATFETAGRWFCVALGWAMLVVIVYATLSSIEPRPSMSWLLPDGERFLAFFVTALAFGLGYPRHRALVFGLGVGMLLALELGQLWVSARHGALHDAWVKAAGLGVGLTLLTMCERALPVLFRSR